MRRLSDAEYMHIAIAHSVNLSCNGFLAWSFVEHNYGAGPGLRPDKDKEKIHASLEAVHPNAENFGRI